MPIAIAVVLTVLALAIVSIPELRLEVLGTSMSMRLAPGSVHRVGVKLSLETGQEIRGKDSPEEPTPFQEDHQAGFILEETVKQTQGEPTFSYRVTELQSEQWEWSRGQVGGSRFDLRLFPNGLPAGLDKSVPSESALTSDTVLVPLFAMLWPRLPDGMVKAGGRQWNGQYPVNIELLGQKITLEENLSYNIEKFTPMGGRSVAATQCVGSIRHRSEVAEADGKIKAVCLIDPETGHGVGADYRIETVVKINLPNSPEYRWVEGQSVQIWRVPDGTLEAQPTP